MRKYYRDVYFRSFKLGALYQTLYNKVVKFIKVTPKGYNLLDIETNKCIMRHHLYSRDFSYKEIPENVTKLHNVAIRNGLIFKELKNVEDIKQ